METTFDDMQFLHKYVVNNGATLTIDTNPSEEKISRIQKAIQNKQEYFAKAIEKFSNIKDTKVNN